MYARFMIQQSNYRASKIQVNKAKGYIKGSLSDVLDYTKDHKGSWHNYTFTVSYENNIIEVRHHDHTVLEIDVFDKHKPKLVSYEYNKSCSSMYNGNSDYRAISGALNTFNINNIDLYYDDKEKTYKVDYKENIEAWNTKRDLERAKNKERYYKGLRRYELRVDQLWKIFDNHINMNVHNEVTIKNNRNGAIVNFHCDRYTIPEYTIDLYGNFIMKLIEWNEYNTISTIWLIGKDCYDQPWAYEFSDTFTYAHMSILYLQYALLGIRKRDLFETIEIQTIAQRCKYKKGKQKYCYANHDHVRLKTIARHDKPRLIMYS